jgi:hypothetical protein
MYPPGLDASLLFQQGLCGQSHHRGKEKVGTKLRYFSFFVSIIVRLYHLFASELFRLERPAD